MSRYAALLDRGPLWANTPISSILVRFRDAQGYHIKWQHMTVEEYLRFLEDGPEIDDAE
jgi:hypothetical protein